MIICRKNSLYKVKTSDGYNKKKVMPKFCLQQNFPGIFLFDLIRRPLEFFRILRKNRGDIFGFSCAKMLVLALVFCLGVVNESRAGCEGYSACRNTSGSLIANCCYKVEGDTTTIYPDDEEKEMNIYSINLSKNKNLVIEGNATNLHGDILSKFESVNLSENIGNDNWKWCGCCWYRPQNLKYLIISDYQTPMKNLSCITGDNTLIVCLGDIEKCKTNVGSSYADRVVKLIESQPSCGSNEEFFNGRCAEKCTETQERVNGNCVEKCAETQERVNGNCVEKCAETQERVNGVCESAPVGCIGASYSNDCYGGWRCSSCEAGYELYDNCFGNSCRKSCAETQERVNGNCVEKCPEKYTRTSNGGCVKTTCDSGEELVEIGYSGSGDMTCCRPSQYDSRRRVCCSEGYRPSSGGCAPIRYPDNCEAGRDDGVGYYYTCTKCSSGFVIDSQGACIPATDCKNGMHEDNGACVANTIANCNTESNGKCSECINGTLEQDGKCVSSCGSGYKDMGGFCNRVHYTPAEAAAVANDDNTNVVTITFKK